MPIIEFTDEEMRAVWSALCARAKFLSGGIEHYKKSDPNRADMLRHDRDVARSAYKKIEELE